MWIERRFAVCCQAGSTLIGCEQTGRKAYLMELDELYCELAGFLDNWEQGYKLLPIGRKVDPAELFPI